MRKLSVLVLLLLSVLICVAGLQAEQDKYRIGVIIPLSGPYASLGNYLKKGIDLAYSRLPEERRAKIELIYEDDQLESRKSVSAFQKLVSTEKIDAVFVLGSGVGNALAPLAERKKTLMVAIGASDKTFASEKDYVFVHWVSAEEESNVMLEEIKRRGYKKLVFLGHEQDGVIAVENAFKEQSIKQGLADRVLFYHRELLEVRDFKTFIAKTRAKNVDGVVTALLPGGLATFVKQARDLRLEADIFGFELFEDENEVKASDGALIGKWYVNADESDPVFVAEYKKTYNEHPGWAAANAYDTLNLLVDAVGEKGKDNLAIAGYFKSLKDYSGACGKYSASGDNRFSLPATVKIVEKDGFRKLSESKAP